MINLKDIRDTARDMLTKGEVRAVVGWQQGSRGMAAEPVIITAPEQADNLVWNPTCYHNLSLYLVNDKKAQAHSKQKPTLPIAIIVKGCDARSTVVLMQENYFKRDEVYIIGVSCEGTGVIDERKLAIALKGVQPASVAFDGDEYVITLADGNEKHLPAREVMAERCLECREPFPKENNIVLGEDKTGRALDAPFSALARFEEKPESERWNFWKHQFERCIRCFACRSVCPMCFCDECVVDSIEMKVVPSTTAQEKADRIRWIERSATTADNFGYHMTRAMHLAGRCIDCGECERVCPVNIPLRLLNNKMEREARERFGYEPGASIGAASLVASFRDDDPNAFIR